MCVPTLYLLIGSLTTKPPAGVQTVDLAGGCLGWPLAQPRHPIRIVGANKRNGDLRLEIAETGTRVDAPAAYVHGALVALPNDSQAGTFRVPFHWHPLIVRTVLVRAVSLLSGDSPPRTVEPGGVAIFHDMIGDLPSLQLLSGSEFAERFTTVPPTLEAGEANMPDLPFGRLQRQVLADGRDTVVLAHF